MKDLHLLVWITQLGLSVAAPLAGFTLLGVYLQRRFQTGKWLILAFVIVGLLSAVSGLRETLKVLERQGKKKDETVIGFNQHE
ncbi:MAG: AtpZ/AtpI family protein [Clostridia bacterium]|nr:AtpZ/AtpI family protein [Clostridia bacterium]